MKKILDLIGDELKIAFIECGYDTDFAKATISNRPDLCEYQCNAAMALAKQYKNKPIDIALTIVDKLKSSQMFETIEAVMPGFININISKKALKSYLIEMSNNEGFGIEKDNNKTIIVDYGGANVAKPLHIGHLRSAIIGESIKRMGRYFGNNMIGDVHLGDWGLQMGLIIEELKLRKPGLCYFDENFKGEYPKEAPFDITELEDIYPKASARSKEDSVFKQNAQQATLLLQNGYVPYRQIWKHIIEVSIKDLKKNYDNLDVSFELWKGESDAQPYIPLLIKDLEDRKIAYESEGALVVDIQKEDDTKELPPCIIRKSDGAALYSTSDLATLIEREKLYNPDEYIYITDKRQDLHFTQVFRVARIADIVKESHKLTHIGFGTMNGSDGKPFKTRDGGVMRLENLISDIQDAVFKRIVENRDIDESEALKTAKIVGLSALKYGDLSNQASKDYVFDIDRFTSFEGNTGPYILYTIVRIKSILQKNVDAGNKLQKFSDISEANTDVEKKLQLELSKFNDIMQNAWNELAPHKICQYIYSISNAFNSFYHEIKILGEEDENRRLSYLALIELTKNILLDCIDILGMKSPEKM